MTSKKIKSYFEFSRSERIGVIFLFSLIIIFQMIYYFVDFSSIERNSLEKEKWLSLQSTIDSMKQNKLNYVSKIYPFNPNFITDFKGYKLGMSVIEIDRLLTFRKQNKYVNSPEEFQVVTKVSDSLLRAISPYFKFPDWVNNKKEFKDYKKYPNTAFVKKKQTVVIDINQATQEDLIKIYGVGEAISLRILKFKESLGGFVSMEQMKDVWGLSPEVVETLNTHFKILVFPKIKKIDVNNASLKELSQFPYFRYSLAKEIVTYRSMNGDFKTKEDLSKIKDFPVEKIPIITLYLAF